MWAIRDFLNHQLITSTEHTGSVCVLTNADHSEPANATALLRPAQPGRALGREPAQTVLHCTRGLEAEDSVPESSAPTHTRELPELSSNHDRSCGSRCDRGHCQQSADSSAHPRNKPKSSLCCKPHLASATTFLVFGFPFFFNKVLFSWLSNSQQHWTQRITFKGSR